ncbi:MAG TPA: Dyp-type peroxidase [Candidatus Rothia avicola]|uniref:Dyp-type peroxidase n=1 Tax=Candidatus Rothia avicola TaxID=2840478 RepID=A0A9D2CQK4_9MICC|nr:Dyp-type peroxidase [Candidatus Rothia avicola]
MNSTPPHSRSTSGLSRRAVLALTGAGSSVTLLGGLAAGYVAGQGTESSSEQADITYDFYGVHQAGITTAAQDRMHCAAFDMAEGTTRDDLILLLQDWTYAASRLTLGLDVTAAGAFGGGPALPPPDTGEAADLGASGLTITFGFGRSLFTQENGTDRFGLAGQLPQEFEPLPKMVNDFIDTSQSGGDLFIQACAYDPQVAVHAIRNLTRMAVGIATLRWSQLGFGRTSSTTSAQATPRNLFGQKDGTSNIKAEETDRLAEHVWINQGVAAGGSYLIARKVSMNIEVWDGVQLQEQERVTGRDKPKGAPLSGGDEFTAPDFSARDENGNLLIDERSHIARVHPDHNQGIAMLRRGYNYVDGNDAQGRLAAGLFFIAFVNDPARFATVHKNMARDDLFVEYLKTRSSSVFLVPPGVAEEGGYIGQVFFERA